MLFYQDLDSIVFNRNQLMVCDELVVISGYVGPNPINKLEKLPIKSTVIYGMYGCDGIRYSLHNALKSANQALSKVDILYSTIPVHAKCYIWKNKGKVCSALVGSANFSNNGLTTPFKEVLADATVDTFGPLEQYIKLIIDKAIPCDEAVVSENKTRKHTLDEDEKPTIYEKDICSMPLFTKLHGKLVVPAKSGLNWGFAHANVNINDAYIRIGTDLIEHYPELFPPKQECPSPSTNVGRNNHRHNDNIEIIWDDGTTMAGLLEGSVTKEINGKKQQYPKQIASTPSKALLGKYLRKRMNVKEGYQITYEDLRKYGRTTIDVSLQGEGVYYFDFSVKKDVNQSTIIETSSVSNSRLGRIPFADKAMVAERPLFGNVIPVSIKQGTVILHKEFGRGTVQDVSDGEVTIQFETEVKKFRYPEEVKSGFIILS